MKTNDVYLPYRKGNYKKWENVTKFQPYSVQPLQVQVTTDTCAYTDENQVCQRIYCVPKIENNHYKDNQYQNTQVQQRDRKKINLVKVITYF